MDSHNSHYTYKQSGVDWLGEVPEHWAILPSRALFDEIKDRGFPDEQMLSVTINKGVIRQLSLLENTSNKDSSNLDKSKYKLIHPGDIVYNKMRAWQGAIGVSSYRGIISPAYVVQRSRNDVIPYYFHQLFRTPSFTKEAERWSYGIASDMWSLRPEDFKIIYVCLPPLPEQAAIARYLDYVSRRIQRYIGAKQKLIELLEEQKQVIIHRAVTRGLDPDVPLKDSGVEWLGEVPARWNVQRLKENVANVINHTTDRKIGELYIALEHIESWTGRIREAGPDVSFDSQVKRFQVGDVLFGKLRPYLAKVARPNRKGVCVGEFLVLRVRGKNINANYLCFFLRSKPIIDVINTSTYGARMPRADWSFIGNIKQPLPPLPEQIAIIEYLDKATANIDTVISRTRREIELLDEYRTRLIADVVTGKVDVREMAALLPEKPAELAPLDDAGERERAKQLDFTLNTAYVDSSAEQPQVAAGETRGTYLP